MNTPFSKHLTAEAPLMRQLIERLGKDFEYVSILSTDSVGFSLRITPRVKRLTRETMTTERGHVARMYREGCYFEYAFNEADADSIDEKAAEIMTAYRRQQGLLSELGIEPYETASYDDCTFHLFASLIF